MGCIKARPGIDLNTLRAKLDLSNGTAIYHLQVLEREGLLKSRRDGLHRRFYTRGTKVPKNAFYPSDLQARIIELVVRQGRISQACIRKELGLGKERLRYHIRKLEKRNMITLEKEGSQIFCSPGSTSVEMDYVAGSGSPELGSGEELD